MNTHYNHRATGTIVTAARIVRTNLGTANTVASVRNVGTGTEEKYVISASPEAIVANPGDWVIRQADGKISAMSHSDFAATHDPSPK